MSAPRCIVCGGSNAHDDVEAQRRVQQACDLIRSAYRLSTLRPQDTIASVKAAIVEGVEQQAADVAEDVERPS